MASYYPEGECFFLRSTLKYNDDFAPFSAEDPKDFYSHVLIEYQWNGWVVANNDDYGHPRSDLKTGYGSQYDTQFGNWDRFWVGETKDTDPSKMLAITTYPNSLNWNEMRDRDNGGPRKYILRPVRIKDPKTQWLWIDATIPIRAIYFPVCQKTDEAYPNYCTYVVIDFKARTKIESYNTVGELRTHECTRELGLGLNRGLCWLFKVPDIITYLVIPRKLRNPSYGVYRSKTKGDEMVLQAWAGLKWKCDSNSLNHMPSNSFCRQIDLAQVMSATFGVEVGWRPYKYSSFILDIVKQVVTLGLGFVPGAGAILSVAFGMGLQLLDNPDSFKTSNVLDLSSALLATLVASAGKSKKYIAPGFLPSGAGGLGGSSSGLPKLGGAPKKGGLLDNAENALDDILHADLGDALEDLTGGGKQARKKAGDAENSELTASARELPIELVSLAEENHGRGFSDDGAGPGNGENEAGEVSEGMSG
ncbi:hypothetical protein EJ05DRAFT_474902 [Pseudovirgaria hyperparasitica]|uniref:Uncharacterized protein n=1 Tax=Pseudovirgaria hyperparasitica TaxID=470096 RepID=A0A6A6WAG2_9PEZI|nr:uncharacterized protein EJ05DRAFT_474902 [Pseudovirgaria hyperparasitica]KAF2759848.1 hypothetical protein EJ05DRAFT_474902 [Pseudovirgaria hyperparasitica]